MVSRNQVEVMMTRAVGTAQAHLHISSTTRTGTATSRDRVEPRGNTFRSSSEWACSLPHLPPSRSELTIGAAVVATDQKLLRARHHSTRQLWAGVRAGQ